MSCWSDDGLFGLEQVGDSLIVKPKMSLYKVHRSQGKPLQDIKLLIPVKDNSQRTYRAQTDVLKFICNNKFESIWHLSIIAVLTSIEYLQEM